MSNQLEGAEFLRVEPAAEYHAQAEHFLSSHQLADFRTCPQLFYQKRLGLIPDEFSPAFHLGLAAHTSILEGWEKLQEEYAFGGPINPRTGKPYGSTTKAFLEWQREQGKPVLTDAQLSLVHQMTESVLAHDLACELLDQGFAERVVRSEYCERPCQIRIDWLEPVRGLVDLKTCEDLDRFERQARSFGYVHQLAFYSAVLATVIGLRMPCYLLAVEKKPPFRCGVWQIPQATLEEACRVNEAAIQRLTRCEEEDLWPTDYEDLRLLTLN